MGNERQESLEFIKKSLENNDFSALERHSFGDVSEEQIRFKMPYKIIDDALLALKDNDEFSVFGNGCFLNVSFNSNLTVAAKEIMEKKTDCIDSFVDAPVRREGQDLVESFSNLIDYTILSLSNKNNEHLASSLSRPMI